MAMAYVILSISGEELDRRELVESITVGRAADCDIAVHDILLSRKHCLLEPAGDGWALLDLESKNGTTVNGTPISLHILRDGDVVQIGKVQLSFHTSTFIPRAKRTDRPTLPPQALSPTIDSAETLFGTVLGDQHLEGAAATSAIFLQRRIQPIPRPRPADPPAFVRDGIYSMLEEIASSSWDSIYEINARPVNWERPTPRPIVRRPAGESVGIELQVTPAAAAAA
jgi:predicted component of type VI protein secretion system